MVSKILSATNVGFDGQIIDIECDSSKGLPSLQIVGLANKAVDEAKERVRSAIKNSHLDFPKSKLTINLAPANLPKDGAQFDLPIALAILVNTGQILNEEVENSMFVGELSLDGDLRAIRGALHIAETAQKKGIKTLYLPVKNAPQASLIPEIDIVGVSSLKELYLHLKKEKLIVQTQTKTIKPEKNAVDITIDDVYGQVRAKRALAIAAAGHHNVLFTGPPGTGKTMLAQALVNLLPELSKEEQIEVTKLHSLSGENITDTLMNRPFRSPHHTASHISLIGGGKNPLPGEISLAHNGVLFLDELPEYPRSSLEALRQPLEDNYVHISRADSKVKFPANFMLIATKNPCPCGYYGDTSKECTCSNNQIVQYQKKISGPLLDRIDLIVHVGRVPHNELLKNELNSEMKTVKERIALARGLQKQRYKDSTKNNADISSQYIKKHIPLSEDVKNLLSKASERLQLSTRSYFKVIKVAQTIADLESSKAIDVRHVAEALQFRDTTQPI